MRADSGNRARPGVFSLTWIDVRSDEEADEVRAISRPLAAELTKEPGFISWIGVVIANRLYTITAWETEEAAQPAVGALPVRCRAERRHCRWRHLHLRPTRS